MKSKQLSLLSVVCTLVFIAGCGESGPEGAQPTYATKVKVTYKNAPVEGAMVSFINETAPAYGRTDANGEAIMKTYKEGDGAIATIHNVTINKTNITGAASEVDQDSEEYDPAAADANLSIEYLVPQKYSSPVSSQLVADVKSTADNTFEFNLED